MTTSQNVPDADVAADSSGWMLRVVGVAVLVAVVATVLSVAAGPFSSRFWAQRVAGLVGGGAYPSGGVVVGFVLGALSTTVALFATLVSSMAWRRRGGGPGLALCSGFLALVAMLPVAGTLVIALGIGSYGGARTAQQILDVDAPGYSEAAVAGIAAGFGAYTLVSAVFAYRLRRTFGPVRELRRHRAEWWDIQRVANPYMHHRVSRPMGIRSLLINWTADIREWRGQVRTSWRSLLWSWVSSVVCLRSRSGTLR